MGMTADDFAAAMRGLLPPGPAWDTDGGGTMAALIDALAVEFARIDERADGLAVEADPRSTSELLPDYERVFGLPLPCLAETDLTVDQRRAALIARMVGVGGQTKQYLIALAAAFGFAITITEFRPFRANSRVNDPLYSAEARFVWHVASATNTIRPFRANSRCNEPLRVWGNEMLECVLSTVTPAHTKLIFYYSLPEAVPELVGPPLPP